ncbi:alpha/beta hydrolase [Nocardia sp. NBC_01499]|uniref:alpha/beta hydrolase n=1 Tax=Nocardia sp. NBC_01499 TaxID=2903597 RepID=UPI0038651E31
MRARPTRAAVLRKSRHLTETRPIRYRSLRDEVRERRSSDARLVTLQDVRIHMTFRPKLSTCVNAAINTYFGEGTLPAEDTTYADQAAE